MEKYDVFISYSRLDSKIVDRICQSFDKAGITYFIDRQGLSTGVEFPGIIAKAIKDSTVFLFIASENSYKSKFTNNEVTYAFNKKEKGYIIPYIIDGSHLPDELELVFSSINWRKRTKDNDAVVVEDIRKLLAAKKPKREDKPVPPPMPQPPVVKKESHKNLWKNKWVLISVATVLIAACVVLGYIFFGGSDSGSEKTETSASTNYELYDNSDTPDHFSESVLSEEERNNDDYLYFNGYAGNQPFRVLVSFLLNGTVTGAVDFDSSGNFQYKTNGEFNEEGNEYVLYLKLYKDNVEMDDYIILYYSDEHDYFKGTYNNGNDTVSLKGEVSVLDNYSLGEVFQ